MNEWKITIPVSRVYEENQELFLEGEASGPERDTHNSEMSPDAIVDFSRQIQERVEGGNPLPYVDAHGKESGVLSNLGWVMRASVDPNMHLRVLVRLDENNPAAQFLHHQAKVGKQYGMSIKGDSPPGTHKWLADDTGNRFVRFDKVVLKEISNTTKPSWVPSFGTVLARSVDGEIGVENMADTLQADTPVVTDAAETVVPETTTESTEVENSAETEVSTTGEVEVERARISKADRTAILAAYDNLTNQLKAIGLFETEEASAETATPETTSVENSDTDADATTDLEETGQQPVERSLEDTIMSIVVERVNEATAPFKELVERQAEYIKRLEALPAGELPAPVVREKFENDIEEATKGMSAEEKMKLALTTYYEGR